MGIPGCEDRAPGDCGRPGAGLWWAEQGSGEPLVLLHGGLTDARFFSRNVPVLAERFHVYTPDARGHGHTPDRPGPITAELLAQDTAAFLDSVVGGPAHLAGHSMGGGTALHVALRRPDLVRRLILISASIRPPELRDPASPWPGLADLVRFLGPGYGEVSPDGEAHFPVVAGKTVTMHNEIPDTELAIVPGTSHFLLREKPDLCNAIMLDFLTGAPVPAVPPVRRARAGRS